MNRAVLYYECSGGRVYFSEIEYIVKQDKISLINKKLGNLLKTIEFFSNPKYNDPVMQIRNFENYFKKKKESALIMRKQTKLVAVLSAAALLAIGASMTSFAAGWQKNDDGSWNYYDSDDEMVAGEWKKDGAKWFYLDDDGVMLTDAWVDDEYYVGDDGAMLINGWKKTLADEDIEDPEDDGEAWYYFGSKGKKVSSEDKKIGGKTYYFDTDGKMEDGWYGEDGDAYYLGDEDDGARKSGWLWLTKPEDDDQLDCDDQCEACDEEGWYYFGSNGKMYKDAGKKKVNGKWYFFNEHGQMLYEWINGAQVDRGSNAQLDGSASPSGVGQVDSMIYTNVVEEGWRADGWYEIDGSEDTNTDSDTDWYYFKDGAAKKAELTDEVTTDKDGIVRRSKIKVAGKYFCFNEFGQMQTGLQAIAENSNVNFYFFDDNGYMKTGKVANVEEDNDSFTYYFNTKNGKNGVGVNGEKDGYLYFNGKRLEADDDYRLFQVDGTVYLVNNKGKLQKSTSKDYTIENAVIGGDDLKITMADGSTYGISKVGGKDVKTADGTIHNEVTKPEIELYDDVYTIGGWEGINVED